MLTKYFVLLLSSSFLLTIFTACESIISDTNTQEKILTQMVSDNGKIVETEARPYHVGSYIKVKGKPSVWRREVSNYRLSPEWRKTGKIKITKNHPFQSYRTVYHYQILVADVEYVYCRRILTIDMLSGKPVCMPPVLKKTWKMKNSSVLETFDVNTNKIKSGIVGLGIPGPATCIKPGCDGGKDCPRHKWKIGSKTRVHNRNSVVGRPSDPEALARVLAKIHSKKSSSQVGRVRSSEDR